MAIHLEIENLASKYGFIQEDWDEHSKRITFKNEKHHIDIYLSKMTIGHKKIGESQQFLYRKNLTINQIEDYFIELTGWNMREETTLEYWKKRCKFAETYIKEAIDNPKGSVKRIEAFNFCRDFAEKKEPK